MNRNSSQAATLISRSNKKSKVPLLLGCLVAIVLLFVLVILGGFLYSTTSASGQSIISIRAPQEGDQLIAGQPVQVRALARDDHKVTRIELWIDNVLIDVQESNTPGGINPFPLLTTWYPTEGVHTLVVRAFNGRGNSFQASMYVTAAVLADRDADGIADDADACPDAAGSAAAEGCPDRDFDGVTDATDLCPDEAGLPPTGCPAPSDGDRDGDGMLDHADACPDEVGSPLADGCPDADGDGTPDGVDACPAEPGAGADGCPEPGGGLPPDPVPDGGADVPMPRPGDAPPDPADDPEPEEGVGPMEAFPLPEEANMIPLEIEAYMLFIRGSFDSAWCYVRLGDEDPRRYDFEPDGDQMWNIAEEFSGENSVRILHAENEPLTASLNCFGANEGEEPVEITPLSTVHPPEEWDGRNLSIQDAGVTIEVRYHICAPSCDETILQTPLLAPVTTGPIGNGPYTLRWRWGGNESEISGFVIARRINSSVEYIWLDNPSARSLDLAAYMPACGERVTFDAVAFRHVDGGTAYSARSNVVEWAGDPCMYTASVTFTTIEVHNPPADEEGLHRPGPIYGNFWVSNGTTVESLDFNACWCYFGPGMTDRKSVV